MLVYGRNVAKEILSGNKKINKITIIEDFSDKDILSLIEKRNIKPICLKKNEFSRFDKFSHQGIIPVSYTHLDVYKRQQLKQLCNYI